MTPKLLLIISIILIVDSIRSLHVVVNEKNKLTNKRLWNIFKKGPTNIVENKINDGEDTFFKEFSQNFLKMATQNEHDHHIWKSLLNKWLRDEEKQSKVKNEKETNVKIPIFVPYEYKIRSG